MIIALSIALLICVTLFFFILLNHAKSIDKMKEDINEIQYKISCLEGVDDGIRMRHSLLFRMVENDRLKFDLVLNHFNLKIIETEAQPNRYSLVENGEKK